jgi:hypothetical protein
VKEARDRYKGQWEQCQERYEQLEIEYIDLEEEYSALEYDMGYYEYWYDEYSSDYWYFAENMGVIVDGVKNYHKYDCYKVADADSWYVHNKEYCSVVLNYAPCPDCW